MSYRNAIVASFAVSRALSFEKVVVNVGSLAGALLHVSGSNVDLAIDRAKAVVKALEKVKLEGRVAVEVEANALRLVGGRRWCAECLGKGHGDGFDDVYCRACNGTGVEPAL